MAERQVEVERGPNGLCGGGAIARHHHDAPDARIPKRADCARRIGAYLVGEHQRAGRTRVNRDKDG